MHRFTESGSLQSTDQCQAFDKVVVRNILTKLKRLVLLTLLLANLMSLNILLTNPSLEELSCVTSVLLPPANPCIYYIQPLQGQIKRSTRETQTCPFQQNSPGHSGRSYPTTTTVPTTNSGSASWSLLSKTYPETFRIEAPSKLA